MINSDFDRVIRGENNNKNKIGKFKIIITIFVVFILIIGGLFGYLYYSQYKAALPRIKFFEYIGQTNINEITDTKLLNGIFEKMNQNSYTITNDISLLANQEENILSKLNLNANYYRNKDENLNKLDLIANDGEKELIRVSSLLDNENVAIKSDEIVVKYVGSKLKNIGDVVNKIYADTDANDENNIEKEKIEIPNNQILLKYKELLTSKLLDEQFKIEKKVKLTENNSSVEATLYQLNFSKEEILQIVMELQDTLINDDELINSLITDKNVLDSDDSEEISGISPDDALDLINGYKINVKSEKIKEEIENNFTKIFETLNKIENLNFRYDIYVSNSKVIKQAIILENVLEINLDFKNISQNENSVKATILLNDLQTKDRNGFSININRKNNNVTTNIAVEISIIENMQINNKIAIDMLLEGNESSNIVNNNITITVSDTEGEYVSKIKTKLEYILNENIEKLNNENCLFLDELDSQTLKDVINAISLKSIEVFSNKMSELSNITVEQPQNSGEIVDMDGEEQSNSDKKLNAKNKLIDAISKEMKKAEDENREYALINLQELKIEGSTLSVIVNENLAIVAIDGYTFYIDPNFVLTEE